MRLSQRSQVALIEVKSAFFCRGAIHCALEGVINQGPTSKIPLRQLGITGEPTAHARLLLRKNPKKPGAAALGGPEPGMTTYFKTYLRLQNMFSAVTS